MITGASVNSDTDKLTETAKEFEAIFTAQLLSMMRDTASQTDFLGGNSTSMKIFNSMLDEQYALRMAESGQLGLADMLIRQLSQYIDTVEGSVEEVDTSLGEVDGQQAAANLEEVLEAVVAGLTRGALENAPDIDLESLVVSSQIIPDEGLEPVSVSDTSGALEPEIDIAATDVGRFADVTVSTEANFDDLLEDEIVSKDLDQIRNLFDDIENKSNFLSVLESTTKAKGVQIFIGAQNFLFKHSGLSMVMAPYKDCLLYTSPSPRDLSTSRMPSSA